MRNMTYAKYDNSDTKKNIEEKVIIYKFDADIILSNRS